MQKAKMAQKAKTVSSRPCLEDSERVSDVPSKVHGTEGQEMSTGAWCKRSESGAQGFWHLDGGLGHGGHAEGRELESMSRLLTGLLIITRVLLLLLLSEEPQYVKINIVLKEPGKRKQNKTMNVSITG